MKASEPSPASGRLVLVATPIGNLGDVTYRAVETLRTVDAVLAEDTRHTRRLFARYGITTPLRAYHDHNKARVTPRLVERLRAGETLALVTDAGTPGIADPGFYLVRAAIEAGVPVTALPGPSALLTALVVSGFPTDAFVFGAFLPRRPGALARAVEALRDETRTAIFYVSPHQLERVLAAFAERLPERRLAVARELTKIHEEVRRGTAAELLDAVRAARVRGEIVLVVHGAARRARRAGDGPDQPPGA